MVLLADVVDYTRLMQRDRKGTVDRLRDFVAVVGREDVARNGGRIFKTTGDGVVVEFGSAIAAVDTAFAMLARIALGNVGIASDLQLQLRIGIDFGEVDTDGADLWGDPVNRAERLMKLGAPQAVIVSTAVRDQLADGLGVSIEDLGERRLKGFDAPVRAFRAWPPGARPVRSADRAQRAGDRPSIAVLPFQCLGQDEPYAFLGDVIAEEVIAGLSRLTDLLVISRLSTAPFRDLRYEPRSVAEALGVRYVLSGTTQLAGNRLRLKVQLTEAEPGVLIWAGSFTHSYEDIFDLQEQLSREIAAQVAPHLRQEELRRVRSVRPENLTAYEKTLRAVDRLHRSAPADLDEAQRLLQGAIESDSQYASAYAWLARLHVLRIGQGWSQNRDADAAAARRHVGAALEIDALDPWVMSVGGLVTSYLDKELEAAIETFDRALAINPSVASAWVWSTSAHTWLGRGDEAVGRAYRGIDLSPFDPHMYQFLTVAAMAHVVAGHYDTAIELVRRALRVNRMYVSTHRTLVMALALACRDDEARQAAVELLALEPRLTVAGFRARYPGSRSAHADRLCAALAAAGVPA